MASSLTKESLQEEASLLTDENDKEPKKRSLSFNYTFHGETWHGGQSYKNSLAEGPSNASGKWMGRQTTAKQPLMLRPSIRRQHSSPLARTSDDLANLASGLEHDSDSPRRRPVEATVHGAEPALPDLHFWRIRSLPQHAALQRQPSDLVLVLPRPETAIDIEMESKREPQGGSMRGGLGASLVRTLSLSLSSLSQKAKADERERQPVMLDEAICRICLDQLTEGESWRLECQCKGDMALAHEECAVRWFNLRGRRSCEVCGSDVENLPVLLERRGNSEGGAPGGGSSVAVPGGAEPAEEPAIPRKYRDIPMVLMAATLAYFCFFEQMLVSDEGTDAVATSIPAALILAIATTAVSVKTDLERLWGLSLVQFLFSVIFSQLLYSLARVGGPGAAFLGGLLGMVSTFVLHSIIKDVHRHNSRGPNVSPGNGVRAAEGGETNGNASDVTLASPSAATEIPVASLETHS